MVKKCAAVFAAACLGVALVGSGVSTYAADGENKFVYQESSSYEGICLQVVGAPEDNYRKIGIRFQEAQSLGENGYVTVSFRNLSGANIPFSLTVTDSDGNKWKTGHNGSPTDYNTHWYHPENTNELTPVKEYYACMYLTSEISGGEVFIDLSKLTKVAGDALKDVSVISIGIPAAYNPAEKMELLSVGLADLPEFTAAAEGGFQDAEGAPVTAEELLGDARRTTLYDFTQVQSNADLQARFDAYELLKLNSNDEVTRSFDSYISVSKSESVRGVSLGAACSDGVKFSLDGNGTWVSDDPSDDTYSADKFGYIRLADFSEDPIDASDALAIGMSALYNKSAFRIIVIDADGEAFRAGGSEGGFVFTEKDGTLTQMPTYYNCIWPEKGEGTLLLPYTAFSFVAAGSLDIAQNRKADGVLTKIREIYLSMDMAATSGEAPNRKIAVAAIADVDYAAEKIDVIADLTQYTRSGSAAESAQVNYADPERSEIVAPCSTNAFTNANWRLGSPTVQELAVRSEIEEKYLGDVKILDNFSIRDEGYSDDDLDAIVADYYTTYGEASYVSGVRLDGGMTALRWTVGNYQAEYANLSGGYAGLTVNPVSTADDWGDWSGAKGITLRVRNPQSHEISFNVAFQQSIDGNTVSYRMDYVNSPVYALDVTTGEEFSFCTASTIYLPPLFDGWIRIDFSTFRRYSATGPDEIDFSKDVIAIKITSYMYDNSDMSFIFSGLGLYYDSFTVDWIFGDTGSTIADNMNGEGGAA